MIIQEPMTVKNPFRLVFFRHWESKDIWAKLSLYFSKVIGTHPIIFLGEDRKICEMSDKRHMKQVFISFLNMNRE